MNGRRVLELALLFGFSCVVLARHIVDAGCCRGDLKRSTVQSRGDHSVDDRCELALHACDRPGYSALQS